MELHLSILDGIADRFDTPYFDNLQKYAQRPIGTFHALPVARGKSIFKSNWISDMGRFYGINLFLAESSATTGGLDSLLEPTGNIKVAQDKAARAFGADHVFFVTNGTSTSNKMVEQALLGPATSSWSTATVTSPTTMARSFPVLIPSMSRRFPSHNIPCTERFLSAPSRKPCWI